jgi:hypothetical protein
MPHLEFGEGVLLEKWRPPIVGVDTPGTLGGSSFSETFLNFPRKYFQAFVFGEVLCLKKPLSICRASTRPSMDQLVHQGLEERFCQGFFGGICRRARAFWKRQINKLVNTQKINGLDFPAR